MRLSSVSALCVCLLAIAALVACGGGSSSSSGGNGGGGGGGGTPTLQSITVTPSSAAIPIGGLQPFKADGKYSDGSSKDISSSVSWTAAQTSIATVSSSGGATGVAAGGTLITASMNSVNGTALLSVSQTSFGTASLKGNYAFWLEALTKNGPVFLIGRVSVDGNGAVSGGQIETPNSSPSATTPAAITGGSYSVGADGRGSVTVNSSAFPGSSATFRVALDATSGSPSAKTGRIVEFDGNGNANGAIAQQNLPITNSSLATLVNNVYVFRLGGLDANNKPVSVLGSLALDPTGATITGGRDDFNDAGVTNAGFTPESISSGTVATIDSAGRTTIGMTGPMHVQNLVAYVIASSASTAKMFLLGQDGATGKGSLVGQAEVQPKCCFNNVITKAGVNQHVFLAESGGMPGVFQTAGEWMLAENPAGSQIAGTITAEQDTSVTSGRVTSSLVDAYTIDSTLGRAVATASGIPKYVFYVVNSPESTFYLLDVSTPNAGSALADARQGEVLPGTQYEFTLANGDPTSPTSNISVIGDIFVGSSGNTVSGMADINQGGTMSTVAINGTFTPDASDITGARGTMNVTDSNNKQYTFNYYLFCKIKTVIFGSIPVNGSNVPVSGAMNNQ